VKVLITVLTLAVLTATPVLAATHHNQVVDRPNHLNRSAQPNDDQVIRGGQIIGTDPDPNVRSEIMREYKQGW
jgi:hypothetical protein